MSMAPRHAEKRLAERVARLERDNEMLRRLARNLWLDMGAVCGDPDIPSSACLECACLSPGGCEYTVRLREAGIETHRN